MTDRLIMMADGGRAAWQSGTVRLDNAQWQLSATYTGIQEYRNTDYISPVPFPGAWELYTNQNKIKIIRKKITLKDEPNK